MQVHLRSLSLRHVPQIDDATLATWRAFLNAHARVTRRISAELAAAGLPDLAWYDLLWALHRQPGRSLRVNELAREIVLSPPAMSRFVDRLVAADCVRREPDPDDRRAQRVVLTEDGVDLLRRMWPVYAAGIEEHFGAHLGGHPQRVRATLERIAGS
jgi:DNA-binding MarR family transcriptional regulator